MLEQVPAPPSALSLSASVSRLIARGAGSPGPSPASRSSSRPRLLERAPRGGRVPGGAESRSLAAWSDGGSVPSAARAAASSIEAPSSRAPPPSCGRAWSSRPCSSVRPTPRLTRSRGRLRRRPSPSPALGGSSSCTTTRPTELGHADLHEHLVGCESCFKTPVKNSLAAIERSLPDPRAMRFAPTATITLGRSDAGSPCASDPPIVPR